ncbi:MAG: 1-deoxy-D-xylulose-5-phosphate synthase [Planctomycetota bacterium]
MQSRIMYIESKANGLVGPARIGRVTFSQSGSTIYYRGRAFQTLAGAGFKANYFDVETGEHYWISGPKKNGEDSLYATHVKPEIDEDVRDEYWREIRGRTQSDGLSGPASRG